MNKKLLLLLFLAVYALAGFAKQRTEGEALNVARSFYEKSSKLRSGSSLTLAYAGKDASATRSAGSNAHYYIFNNGEQGFVIVSGDDRAKEILGYSDEGAFDYATAPDNFKYWLDFFQSELKELANTSESTQKAADQQQTKGTRSFATSIAPLLGGIKWNQGDPYNQQCPTDLTTNQTSVTGCVATAMAQIMKYHEWPTTGTGSTSYTTTTGGGITVNANFNTTYEWADMTPTYSTSSTQTQKDAVAKLMFHCGASAKMNYSSNESGATTANVMIALRTYFGYDTDIKNAQRAFYSSSDWNDLVKTELNDSRPVLYSGSSSGGGHAFVCDGYDSNGLFHMNWGWGGSSNGYFELSALNPGTLGIGGGSGGYNDGQAILIGIRPDTGVNTPLVMEMGYESFTFSSATISNIATTTYSLNAKNVRNTGNDPFVGYFGIGLYDELNQLVKYSFYTTGGNPPTIPLGMGSYYSNLPFDNLSLGGLSSGNYKLRMITVEDPAGAGIVKYMRSKEGTNDYINVTITGSTATFSMPTSGLPSLTNGDLSLMGQWFQNRKGRVSIDVINSGTGEYNSNIAVVLLPSSSGGTPQANGTLLCNDPVVAAASETTTIGFSGTVTVSPGSYTLYVLYDPNNFRDAFDIALSSILASIPVTVGATPAAPVLSLESWSFTNPSAIYSNNVEYKANIKNTGGYFDGGFEIYVTTQSDTKVIVTFGRQEVVITQGETKSITFNGNLDLAPGDYRTWISSNNNGSGWSQLDYGKSFTIIANASTGLQPAVADADPVVATQYYDLLGKEVKQPQKGCIYIVKQTHESKKMSVKKIINN